MKIERKKREKRESIFFIAFSSTSFSLSYSSKEKRAKIKLCRSEKKFLIHIMWCVTFFSFKVWIIESRQEERWLKKFWVLIWLVNGKGDVFLWLNRLYFVIHMLFSEMKKKSVNVLFSASISGSWKQTLNVYKLKNKIQRARKRK